MSSLFQIVFKGQLLDGFAAEPVKASAARRLKASPEQIDRLFSGSRAVLKRGLTDEIAQRYFAELQRIGMCVLIEPERVKASPVAITPAADDPIGAFDAFTAPVQQPAPQKITSRDELYDPLKTQIVAIDEDTPPPPESWSQPTIAISHQHLNSMQPTIVLPTKSDGMSDPTLIVAPRQSSSTDQTMIVAPSQGRASDPTMIVPPRSSASSDATIIVAPKSSNAAQATVIVRSNQTVPTTTIVVGNDAHKNLSATSGAMTDKPSLSSGDVLASAVSKNTKEPSTGLDVACPTCGDMQPKSVYCRRCGHALEMPAMPVVAERRKENRPATAKQAKTSFAANEETVLIEDPSERDLKIKKRTVFFAGPSGIYIFLVFVAMIILAAWLII